MKIPGKLFGILIFATPILTLMACNNLPTRPSDWPGVFVEPRGDVYMKLGEEKIFTAIGYNMIEGDKYTWSLYIPNDLADKYCKMEILGDNLVKITALRLTNSPCGLRAYISRNGAVYGKRDEHLANIHIDFYNR